MTTTASIKVFVRNCPQAYFATSVYIESPLFYIISILLFVGRRGDLGRLGSVERIHESFSSQRSTHPKTIALSVFHRRRRHGRCQYVFSSAFDFWNVSSDWNLPWILFNIEFIVMTKGNVSVRLTRTAMNDRTPLLLSRQRAVSSTRLVLHLHIYINIYLNI